MKYFFGKPFASQLERIKTAPDKEFEIENYGARNLYPQEQEQLRLASPLIKASSETLADFIDGNGFEFNGDEVVNEDGDHANDLLQLVAIDYSQYNGFAFWIGFNAGGTVDQFNHIPFEFVRLGIPDSEGKHHDVKVSNNWEQNPDVDENKRIEPITYPLFNPLTAAEETFNGGNGQVLYFTGRNDKYPLTTFDSINDTGKSDKEIQRFEANSATKNFNGISIFRYPGQFESDTEQKELIEKIKGLTGSESAGMLLAQVDEEFTGSLIETIPPNNTDSLFALTRQAIIDRVLMVYKIPPALIGINPSGGVFTQQAYQDSFLTFNISTRTRRKTVARMFNIVGELMNLEFGRVMENQYLVEGAEDVVEAVEEETVEEETPPIQSEPETPEANLKTVYNVATS